ncbi:unnamed protein product [Microthlaspi erraticum]|uniref:Retrotransposon Copia-like N-terminal domain-containing protein n=1 Tax=Microthlaspi erraticum TaxID=1685480 RepID=A0A6D2I983_9BRAS|nr:unnamed protein product [Microthlaspi erraticum]
METAPANHQFQFQDQYENPYFLHSSDHAGLILVSDRLQSGGDFHSWRRSVRMALNVRNKLGFIDGTVPKPHDNHRDAGSWSHSNDMVATWLMNSVSKKIGQSLLFMNTAESIWKNLLARFKQDDSARVFEIEQRLSSIHQGSMDVSTYYTELVTLWEEHELSVCSCGKCECNAVFWSIWSIWDVRSMEDLAHGRSSTGYAKEEGGSHLEDQLDRSSSSTRPAKLQLDRAEKSTVKPEKCCFPLDFPLTLNLILLYLKAKSHEKTTKL